MDPIVPWINVARTAGAQHKVGPARSVAQTNSFFIFGIVWFLFRIWMNLLHLEIQLHVNI